jgi:hypothetical protein
MPRRAAGKGLPALGISVLRGKERELCERETVSDTLSDEHGIAQDTPWPQPAQVVEKDLGVPE